MRRKEKRNDTMHIDTLIGPHTNFKGELFFEGSVRLDGKFEGNIKSSQDGTLIISETASIKGEVDVPNLILHGTIHGNVRATKSIQIGPKGRLVGDLDYHILSLAEGASINGRCNRIDPEKQAPAARHDNSPAAEKAARQPA